MEKINFNGNVFDLSPMGISTNPVLKRRILVFKSDLSYDEIEAIMKDEANITEVKYQSESCETLASYADCVNLVVLSKNVVDGTYTAEFNTDGTVKQLAAMQEQIDSLQQTITAMTTDVAPSSDATNTIQ